MQEPQTIKNDGQRCHYPLPVTASNTEWDKEQGECVPAHFPSIVHCDPDREMDNMVYAYTWKVDTARNRSGTILDFHS